MKILKWIGIVVLCLIVIIVAAALILAGKYNKMAKKEYAVEAPEIAIPTDSASLARGMVIANSVCAGSCHGGDFSGTEFFNEPSIAVVPAPNITKGGRTANYGVKDWVRTVRYGVKPDGHGLFIMPASDFGKMSDADLGCLIAFMQTVPASNKTWPDPEFKFLSKVMAGAGMFGDLYHADLIDMSATGPRTGPEPGPTVAYGAYTVGFHGCASCHGEKFNGFKSPDPVSPPGANITKQGNFGKWTLEQFKSTLRSGTTPEGKNLDPKFMPWPAIGQMTDMEIEAVYNYLMSLEGMPDSEELVKYNEKMAKEKK